MGRGRLAPRAALDDALDKFDIEAEATKNLGKLKISVPPKPEWTGKLYDGILPPNYARLSDDELADLLGEITQHQNFLRGQGAVFSACAKAIKKRLRLLQAYLRKQYRKHIDDRDPKWALDDLLEMDERHQDHVSMLGFYEYSAEIAEACYKAAESDFATVSRVITLRGQSRDSSSRARSARYGGGGRGALK